jgi:4-hydroxy-2-oxoheptanedioate aldolase
MPFENPLRRRWAAGQPTFSAWLSTGEPMIARWLAATGYDEVLADLQHGAIEIGHLPALFQAIESTDAAPAARVPTNDPVLIGRVLDMGALAIVVPMVESRMEAARAVGACAYPPHGNRSMGPLRSMITMNTTDPEVLAEVVCLIQVETAKGLANLEEIASTPGLDGIFIGPSDLALSMGVEEGGTQHADAIREIVAACHRHRIVAAIITGNGDGARKRVGQGFGHVAATSDLSLIGNGGALELAHARGQSTGASS